MVGDKLKSNLTIIISILALIIASITLVFGNNLYERLTTSKITMVSSKEEFKMPEKISKFIIDSDNNKYFSMMPNAIRVIKIKNSGSVTSRNLNINIDLDGGVFQYKLNSAETINKENISNNKLTLSLSRLSRNAEISMIFWMKENNNPFQGTFADDNNSGPIVNLTATESDFSVKNIFIVLILLVSVLITAKEVLTKLMERYSKQSKLEAIRIIGEIDDKISEHNLLKNQFKTEQNIEEQKESLINLIKTVSKL
jgi:hypothetical protein